MTVEMDTLSEYALLLTKIALIKYVGPDWNGLHLSVEKALATIPIPNVQTV